MTSTKTEGHIGGYRREVDFQKLGPTLIIASSLVLAIRTARWPATHSDGLANMEWEKEVEHSVRIGKIVLSQVTARCPEMFQMKYRASNNLAMGMFIPLRYNGGRCYSEETRYQSR
jgi:hypothetical protein